jgi:RNA polymerase sigma factor (sigma-70 family)
MADHDQLLANVALISNAMDGVARHLHLDAADAEDWKQFAWTMLLERPGMLTARFHGRSSKRTFLGVVLKHNCVDWLRHRNRSPLARARDLADVPIALDRASRRAFIDPLVAAEEFEAREERRRSVHASLTSLNAADRAIITAWYFDKRSIDSVATGIGCSPAAAYQRVHRALARLRAQMSAARPTNGSRHK